MTTAKAAVIAVAGIGAVLAAVTLLGSGSADLDVQAAFGDGPDPSRPHVCPRSAMTRALDRHPLYRRPADPGQAITWAMNPPSEAT